MRIEICIAKEKMTKMPTGAVDALKEELTRRISKRYDDVEVIVKATSNDGLSVTRTADKDSAKTFVQETLLLLLLMNLSLKILLLLLTHILHFQHIVSIDLMLQLKDLLVHIQKKLFPILFVLFLIL